MITVIVKDLKFFSYLKFSFQVHYVVFGKGFQEQERRNTVFPDWLPMTE